MLYVVITLVGDDHRLEITAAMDDAVAYMHDLLAIDAGFALEVVEEVRERSCMVLDVLHGLLLRLAALAVRGELEREDGRRGRDVRDGGCEEEVDDVVRVLRVRAVPPEEGDLERRRARVHGEDEAALGRWGLGHGVRTAGAVCR